MVLNSKKQINGDINLSLVDYICYLFSNWRNNRIIAPEKFVKQRVLFINSGLSKFSQTEMGEEVESPSRILSIMFWVGLVNKLKKTDGSKITMIDIGCGSGFIRKIFEDLISDGRVRYHGIDISDSKEWAALTNENSMFTAISDSGELCSQVQQLVEEASESVLIASQSALEHIEGDIEVLRCVNDLVASNAGDGLLGLEQVHVVPSPACLMTYLAHGYRQYSLSRIAERFEAKPHLVVPLGGWRSNLVHFVFITIWERFFRIPVRTKLPKMYRWARDFAINRDLQSAEFDEASAAFYAVLVFNSELQVEILKDMWRMELSAGVGVTH